jgi:CheY-specific phosphatase CheX
MPAKFFGQFLLERGKILKEEFLDALNFQKSSSVKLGTMALNAGYLTADQVERIHQEQQHTDKLFGEIAIQLKYLTPEQVQELLIMQKNESISFGDAVVQKGYLTLHELEAEISAYKHTQEEVTKRIYRAVTQLKNSKITEVFLDLTIKLLRRFADLEMQVVETHNDPQRITPHLWNISQEFFGDISGTYLLSLSDSLLLRIASGVADEKLSKIDDFAKDGVKEFVNILVGNSVSKLSHEGVRLNLKPPAISFTSSDVHINTKNTETISMDLGATDCNLQMSLVYSTRT